MPTTNFLTAMILPLYYSVHMCVFMRKFFYRFRFDLAHFVLVGFAGLLQQAPDLPHGNHREEFREQEVTSEEQSAGPDKETHFPDARRIIGRPAAGEIIPVDGGHDDHKPLEPHAHVDYDGHKEGHR